MRFFIFLVLTAALLTAALQIPTDTVASTGNVHATAQLAR